MGSYNTGTDKWASRLPLDMSPAAAVTETVNGDAVKIGDRGTVRLSLDVTACTGSLDVAIQTSEDGENDWRQIGTFTQATGVTSERKSFGGADAYIRAVFTIVTGPSTFTLEGEAV